MKKLKDNKIFKIVIAAIRVFFTIVILAFLVSVCLQRFSDNKLSLFNYRMFSVVSGSMAPRYNVGDVLISKEVKPSDIKIGDTISYLGNSGDFYGKVITHEVVGIEKDANGKYFFRSRGLTNIVEDPIVLEDQLYGVVVYKTLILSTIYKIISTSIGFYILIIVPIIGIIIFEIVATLIEKEEKRRTNTNN